MSRSLAHVWVMCSVTRTSSMRVIPLTTIEDSIVPTCGMAIGVLLSNCWYEAGRSGQLGRRNAPTRVRQPFALVAGMYAFVYQNVQSSSGSTFIDEYSPQSAVAVCDPPPATTTLSPWGSVP